MKVSNKRLISTALSLSIIFAGTQGIAHAQSSFVSGSSSVETNINQDAKSLRYTELYKKVFLALGHELNPLAQAKADDLLQRALRGELVFENGSYVEQNSPGIHYASVDQISSDDLDFELSFLEIVYADLEIYPNEDLIQIGVASGKDRQYYYIVHVAL